MKDHDRRPIPDPTTLTTAALERDIRSLRELLEAELSALNSKVDQHVETNKISLEQQFSTMDHRLSEMVIHRSALDSQAGHDQDAALAASGKQIEQLQVLTNSIRASLEERISDLKDRVVAVEGKREGIGSAVTWLIAIAALVVTAVIALSAHILTSPSGHP